MRIGKSNTPKTSPIDTFSIVRILGRGSGGLVSLIENRNGERFTMKTVSKKKKAYNPESIRREIAAGLLLRHEGVAAAIRNWEDDDNVYLLMEELEGTDLVSLVESRGGVPFSEKVAKQIFKQLVGIVEHVHSRGIAHRAITLDNVMVDSKRRLDLSLPETGTVKLLQELSRQGNDPANNREIPTVMKEAQLKLKKEMKEEEKSMKNHLSEMKKLPSIHTAQKKKNGESSELDLYNSLKSDSIRETIVELYYHGKWELRRLKLTKDCLIINFLSDEEKRSAKKTIDRTDSKQAKNFQALIKEEVGRREKNKKTNLTDSQETTLEENDTHSSVRD